MKKYEITVYTTEGSSYTTNQTAESELSIFQSITDETDFIMILDEVTRKHAIIINKKHIVDIFVKEVE